MVECAGRVLLFLGNNAYPYDPRARRIAETLVEAHYVVSVICPADSRQPLHAVENGVHVYRFPAFSHRQTLLGYVCEYVYGTAMMLTYIAYLWLRHGFDILHGSNPPETIFFGGLLAKLLGAEFVFDYRDLGPELYATKFGCTSGVVYQLITALERESTKLANVILVVNESYRNVALNRYSVLRSKTVVVRNDPRLSEFVSVRPNRAVREKARIILAYVGNMSGHDGIDHLLHSLHLLKFQHRRDDFYAVLVGPLDHAAAMHQLAWKLGVQDHLLFTGRLPFEESLLSYLAAADICLEPAPSNPLHEKSTLMKLMEYMACGKPIVAYDLPESRFSAGSAALYAKANDTAEFARKIVELMDCPDTRERLGRVGKVRVTRQFNWEASAYRLRRVYGLLLSRKRLRLERILV